MSGYFHRGMISDNFFKKFANSFFEKVCFEKKLNKILKFHFIWLDLSQNFA